MLLAWPGVVVQFLLIALCAKYVFPYNWSWPEAFLFGAMMSATDPVAVVAVLQEVRRVVEEAGSIGLCATCWQQGDKVRASPIDGSACMSKASLRTL